MESRSALKLMLYTVCRMANTYLSHTVRDQGRYESLILYDGVGMPLVSDCQAIQESPQIKIDNQFLQIVQTGRD